MLKFANLSVAQKTCVLAFIEFDSSLAVSREVTNAELNVCYFGLLALRNENTPKVGWPLWLPKANSVRKGVSMWPAPTEDDLAQWAKAQADDVRVAKAQEARKVKVKAEKKAVAKVTGLTSVTPVKKASEPAVESVKAKLQDVISENDGYEDSMADDDFDAILQANGIYA